MGYTIEDIDKIVEFTSWTEKQKLDGRKREGAQ